MNIRALRYDEIPLLKSFAPPEWNTDLSVIFGSHYGKPYFYPIVAESERKIVGCANGIVTGKTAWLGNIIVQPEYRGQGIGTFLTQNLIEQFNFRGCTSQILIATSMGEPIYHKLGFITVSHYHFYKGERFNLDSRSAKIRPSTEGDYERILQIDCEATDEDRSLFLKEYLGSSLIHENSHGQADGFFLPGLGQGLIIAENDEAGLALLSFKVSKGCQMVVVPENNKSSKSFLITNGFQETGRAPRMVLGKETEWYPERIFSRGAGHCG